MHDANTQDRGGVGTVAVAVLETARELCEKVSRMIVRRRIKEYVGTAMNGDPAACSDERVLGTRREMQRQGGYTPIAARLELDACDLADGVPLALVLEPRELEMEWLRAQARPACTSRPLSSITARETKAQARLDLAQFRLMESPTDPTVIAEVLAAADHYAQPLDELRETLRQQLIVHRGPTPPRRFVGQRQRLALHSATASPA